MPASFPTSIKTWTPLVDNVDDVMADDQNTSYLEITAAETFLLTRVAITPGGRLTLTTALPVTTADVTGATSVYYTPYVHNLITLWTGSYWSSVVFTQVTLALGVVTAALPYDIYGYLSAGALAVEKLAWTNGTTRATAISLQDGRYCKTGDKTRLYLGTIYTTSTSATEDSGGGATSQVGGKRFVWNMYNQVPRAAAVIEGTNTWSYTTNTVRQANGAAGNKVEFVLGLPTLVEASVYGIVYILGGTLAAKVGVGVDSTSAFSGVRQGGYNFNVGGLYAPVSGAYKGILAAGYHYLAWCEKGGDSTSTFIGDNSGDDQQSGMYATAMI